MDVDYIVARVRGTKSLKTSITVPFPIQVERIKTTFYKWTDLYIDADDNSGREYENRLIKER